MCRFSAANQDNHDSEGGMEDNEMGKAEVEGVESREKTKA